jgi:NNP family nitrate/nitrite transporter-like MFS transporter
MIFYVNFVSRIVIAPLLPVIEVEFGLDHAQAGSLFLFLAAGYCTGLFASPFVSSRLNHRRTILLAATAVGAAMLMFSTSRSVPAMRTGLLTVGVCAGFYLPSGIAVLTDLVRKEHWGKAMAIHELAPNLSLVTAPLLVEVLLRFMPWRGIIVTLGITSILIGVVFWVWGQGGGQGGEVPNLGAFRNFSRDPSFWTLASVFVLCVGASLGVYAMLPLFLVNEVGMDRQLANTLLGISRAFPILILFLSGMIADRIGHKRAVFGFLAITGVLTLMLGLLKGPVITSTIFFLQPIATVSVFPAALSMVSGIFPSNLRSLGMSLVAVIGFFGGAGLIPQMIGFSAEALSFAFGFTLMGLLVLAALPFVSRLRAP